MNLDEERGLDINFWTAFADLMLALVLVLCLLLFLVMAVISIGTVNLRTVEVEQLQMTHLLASSFGSTAELRDVNSSVIPISKNGRVFELGVRNDLDKQNITFSDQLLFPPDDYRLSANGIEVLKVLGSAIKSRTATIKEVQIQGHADIRRSGRFPGATGNTELAAMRALEVFKFLQSEEGGTIDPTSTLMSITSFGEYLPVHRDRNRSGYGPSDLLQDNASNDLMDRNRRIELVLIYRR